MDKLYTTARKILDDTHTHRSASEYRAVCAQDPTIPKLELFTDETEGQDIFEDYIDVLEKLILLVSTSVNDIYFEGWHETVGMALDRCCCEEQHYVGVWDETMTQPLPLPLPHFPFPLPLPLRGKTFLCEVCRDNHCGSGRGNHSLHTCRVGSRCWWHGHTSPSRACLQEAICGR